jgi:uncharacterized protein (TIGR03437 family)
MGLAQAFQLIGSLKTMTNQKTIFALAFVALGLAQPAYGQARLRLTSTTVGPVSIATGANGAPQTLEAFNVGSGNLSLSFSSNATWLSATAGAQRPCQIAQASLCVPINIAFNTSALARGQQSGVITVRDPNAIDAPQFIAVSVQMGGGVPDTAFLYVPPTAGATDTVRFASNSVLISSKNTSSGGDWLDVAYEGTGSFNFVQAYAVSGRYLPGMAEGTYNGTVQIQGSAFPGDNKTVQTRLVVTSQPIAFAGPDRINLRVAQGSAAQVVNIGVANRGRGTLTLADTTAQALNGSGWISSTRSTSFSGVAVTINPSTLAPGTYRGLVGISTNAINAPALLIPVTLEVLSAPTPDISFDGVRNNATFAATEPLAVGTIAAVFGEFFGDGITVSPGAPLPTTLGGLRVLVNDRPAPIYFTSPGQINFQIPLDATGGNAIVQVERNGVRGNRVTANIVPNAPRILVWSSFAPTYGIIVNANGTLPLPTGVNIPGYTSQPAARGDTLIIYAIGFGQTTPPVQSGAASPANPLAQLQNVFVQFGTVDFLGSDLVRTPASFAGLSPGFVGLFQINVQIPPNVRAAQDLDVTIDYAGQQSNRAKIATR